VPFSNVLSTLKAETGRARNAEPAEDPAGAVLVNASRVGTVGTPPRGQRARVSFDLGGSAQYDESPPGRVFQVDVGRVVQIMVVAAAVRGHVSCRQHYAAQR
jgi:hypothetical protein